MRFIVSFFTAPDINCPIAMKSIGKIVGLEADNELGVSSRSRTFSVCHTRETPSTRQPYSHV